MDVQSPLSAWPIRRGRWSVSIRTATSGPPGSWWVSNDRVLPTADLSICPRSGFMKGFRSKPSRRRSP